jgi:hypothetical protein
MKSLTLSDVRLYCSQPAIGLDLSEDDILSYREGVQPAFFVRAPLEMRQILRFILTLTSAISGGSFRGGLLWLQQYHAGMMDSASLGWRVIEDVRLAHGDARPLDVAPAQHFRSDEETELRVFLLQAVAFGWSGYFFPSESQCFVDFRSSERWFFHSADERCLSDLVSAMKPWNPSYEEPKQHFESAQELFHQAQRLASDGDDNNAIDYYRNSLKADPTFLESARELIEALRRTGREGEARIIQSRLVEVDKNPA